MKRYRYVAVNPKTDQIVRKELTAKSQQEVKSIISSQSMDIVLIEELKEKGIKQVKFGRSVSRPEKINLTNELSIMFKANIWSRFWKASNTQSRAATPSLNL